MARINNYQIEKIWEYPKADFCKLPKNKYSETFNKLIATRGLITDADISAFLFPQYEMLTDSLLIPDMPDAVTVINDAIKNNEKIAIYGDYDVDGITATALLYKFFAGHDVDVITYIPSRHTEGYGLNDDAIAGLAKEGVGLIITVDCGTSSAAEVALAKELGMKVVITDHHALKNDLELPDCPVVNPQRMPSDSHLKSLAGVGVAFYLVRALIASNKEMFAVGFEKWLLDLVALGTVCDIVSLTHDNRILVYFGLIVLKKTKNLGLKALSEIANVNISDIDSYDLGFKFGPRLNAAGRLEHAKRALELLTTEDEAMAYEISEELNLLNKERQELTERIVKEAREIIENDDNKSIYLLSNKSWPAGVVGIVASRLVEQYNRPILVMEDMGNDLKGSARSVAGFNIVEALGECSGVFTHFGGHAFAAGFTLPKDKFVILNNKLLEISDKHFEITDIAPKQNIDLDVAINDIVPEFLSEVDMMAPFGKDNPKPVFSISKCHIVEPKLVGNPAIHLKMAAENEGKMAGIAFGWGEEIGLDLDKLYDLAVNFEMNHFNGRSNVEFRLIDIRENQ